MKTGPNLKEQTDELPVARGNPLEITNCEDRKFFGWLHVLSGNVYNLNYQLQFTSITL